MTKATPKWETFRDRSYYDMWVVRMVGERTFGQGFHVNTQLKAEMLRDLLNTTSQVDALRAENQRLRWALSDIVNRINVEGSPWHDAQIALDRVITEMKREARAALSEPMP